MALAAEELERVEELVRDPKAAARSVGLRYVNSNGPGIRRVKRRKHFAYVGVDGRPVKDKDTLARIKGIVIPPAWTDVWISPIANGHLQATGRDARGRKQYRYHPRWREVRDEAKYGHTIAFAHTLPSIRRRVHEDLSLPDLPREKVLAAVVRLLETTLIRVGNDEYARENKSYGLTTLRTRHVQVNGERIEFTFLGKSGKRVRVDIRDARLARIVKRCRDIPGYELFRYIDSNGEARSISSGDVNDYLREITGQDFTAKDFRTWYGTVLAAVALRDLGASDSQTAAKRSVVHAIEQVADRLGNTAAVCRKCYVHPHILDAYMEGETVRVHAANGHGDETGLDPEEKAVLAFLEKRVAGSAKAS
jgi:DNA topoisomerase-1